MNKTVLIVFFLLCNTLYAQTLKGYINILSNVPNTKIFLNNVPVGTTPLLQYEVAPNETIELLAVIDKKYYEDHITTSIMVQNNTIPTINLEFKKAQTKIFFVGEDAELYINDNFIRRLHDTNRVVAVDAGENVKILLKNRYSEVLFYKDISAQEFLTLEYTLKSTPLDVRLYTASIDDLMWEDTKEAANTDINWKEANKYCESLLFGPFDDFRLPTIEELNSLYEQQEKIYNGFGGTFYWSSTTFKDGFGVWDYSRVKNFEDGEIHKSVKEFNKGRVRCVRDHYEEIEEEIEGDDNESK